MSKDQKIIKVKVGLLELAKQLGNFHFAPRESNARGVCEMTACSSFFLDSDHV